MSREIKYYFPLEGKKNKAGNALLTIDWFKKHFRLPINDSTYIQLNYEESGDVFDIPSVGWIIGFTHNGLVWQGRVEVIVQEKTIDSETIHVLLQSI